MGGIEKTRDDIIRMALIALESYHEDTYRHSVKTAGVAVQLARSLPYTLNPEDVYDAALVHDLGKLRCPVEILDKKGDLTDRERENIFFHPIMGAEIIKKFPKARYQMFAEIVCQHHECPDGKGYPNKLPLHRIAPLARVINISDRFAALTENRPYRKALPIINAVDMLKPDIEAFFGSDSEKVLTALERPLVPAEKLFLHFEPSVMVPQHVCCTL